MRRERNQRSGGGEAHDIWRSGAGSRPVALARRKLRFGCQALKSRQQQKAPRACRKSTRTFPAWDWRHEVALVPASHFGKDALATPELFHPVRWARGTRRWNRYEDFRWSRPFERPYPHGQIITIPLIGPDGAAVSRGLATRSSQPERSLLTSFDKRQGVLL